MNSNVKAAIGFVLGAGIGSAITYLVMKDKMEKTIQDEVTAFKNEYSEKVAILKENLTETIQELKDVTEEKSVPASYMPESISIGDGDAINYTDFYDMSDKDDMVNIEEAVAMVEEIHLSEPDSQKVHEISFDEFDRNEIFTKATLTVYCDGFVGDINDELVLDVGDRIGGENLDAFINSSDDVIYLRNDANRMCYELVKSDYTFEEFTGQNPSAFAYK